MDIDPNLFDSRVVESYIRLGRITRADYEAHLSNLPDDAENATPTEASMAEVYAGRVARQGDDS